MKEVVNPKNHAWRITEKYCKGKNGIHDPRENEL